MSTKEKLLRLDFAALRTLQFVFELGSFSKAADKLDQTQSNVSYTIARLRESFDDPLFVREGAIMVPTERCRSIVLETSKMLETFQAVATQTEFSPETADALVTIACNHYERMVLLPPLIRFLRSKAPGIRLQVLNSHALGEEQLKRGECDVLLGPMQFSGDKIFKRRIIEDGYVCIMDSKNPLCSKDLTIASIGNANHILLRLPGGWRPPYLSRLETAGVEVTPNLELSEYGDIGGYVLETDLIAFVPNMIVNRLDARLIKRELPFEAPLMIDLFWTKRTHLSPLHRWIRSTIATTAKNALQANYH